MSIQVRSNSVRAAVAASFVTMLRTLTTLTMSTMPLVATAAVFTPPEGIYVSSSPTTAEGAHSIQKEDLSRGFVAGVLVRVPWADLETSPGVYNWKIIDNELARADQYNTKVALGILNGPTAPTWLAAQGVQMISYDDASDGKFKTLPVIWDAKYLNYWKNFIAALGARYGDHPRISLVHITHSTGNGFEMQLPSSTEVRVPWDDVGYNEATVIESWKQVVDAFGFAFPNKPLDLEVHPVLRSDVVAQQVAAYASATLGEQIGIFAAWWSQKNASTGYPGMYQILVQGAATTFGAVQLVCSETAKPGCTGTGGMDQAINLGLQSGIRYFEIWNNDIRNANFQDLFTRTANTLGTFNNKPTITALANQTLNEDSATSTLPLTVGDTETAAGSLTVTAMSSNTTLVPVSNIVLGGSGANRTIKVTPKAETSGTATITVIVSDGSQTASATFLLTVNSVNDLPVVSSIANVSINEDASTWASFTIKDVETSTSALTVSATSDNTALVPASSITLGGSNGNRNITVKPAANMNGTAVITVNVSDGTATTQSKFTLTVIAVNDKPTVSTVSNVTIAKNGTSSARSFTISDAETSTSSLTVKASAGNSSLIPASGITLGGSGSNRTVTVKPASNRTGTTTITLTVSDGVASSTSKFTVTVQ